MIGKVKPYALKSMTILLLSTLIFLLVFSLSSDIASAATKLDVPKDVWASKINGNTAKITWKAVSGATSYDIQWQAEASAWKNDGKTTGTSFTSSGLNTYNAYNYRVRARNFTGVSDWSETATVLIRNTFIYNWGLNSWKLPVKYPKITGVGDFDSPGYLDKYSKHHAGIDLSSYKPYKSEPVYAIADGKVYKVVKNGNQSRVYIEHAYWSGKKKVFFTALYGHVNYTVKENTWVKKGDKIGTTAMFNIYHLHFGINTNTNKNEILKLPNWGTTVGKKPTAASWVDPKSFLSNHTAAPYKEGE